jgi:hypothetical protein
MKGSAITTIGYSQYTANGALYAYYGNDSESTGSPQTDWYHARALANENYRADTTLSLFIPAYGGPSDVATSEMIHNFYGSKYAKLMLDQRIGFTIPEAWKTANGTYKLRLSGYRRFGYSLEVSPYTQYYFWDDANIRSYYKWSNDANLFLSGADAQDNFGESEFYVDSLSLNTAQRKVNSDPATASLAKYLYIDIPYSVFSDLIGNTLYLWKHTTYFGEAYYAPTNNSWKHLIIGSYRLEAYY